MGRAHDPASTDTCAEGAPAGGQALRHAGPWGSASRRVVALASSLALVVVCGSLGWWWLQRVRASEIMAFDRAEQSRLLDEAISLDGRDLHTFVADYASRDEMSKFTQASDQTWGNQHLRAMLDTYRAQTLWVLNPEWQAVFAVSARSKGPPAAVPDVLSVTSRLPQRFTARREAHGFATGPGGLIELCAAEIRTTTSALTSGPLRGYLVVMRQWDAAKLTALEHLTGSELSLVCEGDSLSTTDDIDESEEVHIVRELVDAAGHPVATLHCRRHRPAVAWMADATAWGTALFSIGAILVTAVLLSLVRRWVVNPLNVVSRALRTESTRAIRKLVDGPTEFRDIGRLIATSVVREHALRAEVCRREEVERDVRLARDRALAMADAKGRFLASMSHEIRTPMNGVLGMLHIIGGTTLDDEQQDCVATMERSAKALLGLINDILDFSKIESGKMVIEQFEFDLRVAIEDVAELLAPAAAAQGIELVADVASSLPALVAGDGGRLRQILTNLVGNAVKFTRTGGVYVTATPVQHEGHAWSVEIAVEDTGIGIPAERHGAIFEAFTQAEAGTARKFGGSGLGLTITRQLVELMGGTINVTSEVGAGSTFRVVLPFPVRQVAADGLTPSRTLVAASSARQGAALRNVAASLGHRVTAVSTAEEFASLLRAAAAEKCPWDLVLAEGCFFTAGDAAAQDRLALVRAAATRCVAVVSRHQAPPTLPPEITVTSHPLRREVVGKILRGSRAATARPPADGTLKPLAGRRVLVAEDNAVNQKVATKMLARWGCEVAVVADGAAAIAAVRGGAYDLVLMDCEMPEVDGYDATRRIRAEAQPGTRRLPIIALTAHALEEDRSKCIAAGMDDYLSKPVVADELERTLLRWIPCEEDAARPAVG